MTEQLASSIVRILNEGGAIIGAGFLASEKHVLTCAHVVGQASGLSDRAPEMPTAEARIGFPLIAPGYTVAAHVVLWQPESDVAVLELDSDPPAGAQPVRLVQARDLWGHAFRAFGFPAGYDDGVWASGLLRGRTGAGWVQIEDVKTPGYWVQPGFSGTPVWDEQLNGVVGMAVAADTNRITKAAFMIPARELIEAWPELAEHSLEAGSLKHLQMQLARLEEAQRQAADPSRFQPQIDALRERIAAWDGRIERQRERIAEGLEAQRQQMTEERARRREKMRLRVVGQPPLDVADYFKDRQRDLQKLGQLLAEPTTRLVSVLGHGGMGKTALACKVLQDLERHRWPYTDKEVPADGIVYLSTRTAGISLERLFLDCAKLLGGERQERLNAVWPNPQLGTEEKITRLLEALSEGRYVILLDNLEDLLDDHGKLIDDDLRLFFEQGLTASHGAQLLVTSRVALVFRREVMRFDQQVKLLEGLPVEDGVTLLRELDPNGDYGLRDAPEEKLAEAVELTHGVPRALEVLAGILANDPLAMLDEVMETFYEQEDVVQALIEENYKRLDREARRVIEALAVFRRPVPPLAVDYLLEPFAPGLDVPGILRRLTRTNIVSVDRAAKTVTLHPIDQDYAYSQLPEEDETESDYTRQALERRAADYYVQLRTPPETWRSIDDLEPQLAEFEHRVRAEDYDEAYRVLEPIDFDYLYLWGHYARLVEMQEKLLGRLTDPSSRANTLRCLGRAYHSLGQFEQAIGLYQEALAIARKIGDRYREGINLGRLGSAYHDLGESERAIKFLRESLTITREIGDYREEGIQLGYLARAHRALGQIDRAIVLYEEALAIIRKIGDRREEGGLLGRLGTAYRDLGQVRQALKLREQALIIAREIGDRREEGVQLGSLGRDYKDLGKVERAIKFLKESLTIACEIGDRRREGINLGHLGDAYRALGQVERAIKVYERALTIARKMGDRRREGVQRGRLGDAYRALGQIRQAIGLCEVALSISCEIGDRWGESYQSLRLGKALLADRELYEASQHCQRARDLGMPRTSHQAVLVLGIVLLYQRDLVAGESFADAAARCRAMLDETASLYVPSYALAAALVGQAVCNPRWAEEGERAELLTPALAEYRRALEITAAPGVVAGAIRDLKLIREAGIEGLEPAFELLENAEYEPDLPEDLPDILQEVE